ncbi:MAG TPA: dethiobiotin synthase [Candidatus Acidoferrales bacterium]|nr:dethiobiotin synthase [Candidatus Acidoferrales bacterium]
MMAAQYFVTGTDTGVGKTVVSALLCAALDASFWKPIQTGTNTDSDSATVAQLAELPPERIFAEAYRFAPPVSPHLAAREARAKISLSKISIPVGARDSALIVEGAGGVLVPVNDTQYMRDVMRELGLPIIVAARNSLGTINHTLLTLAALRASRLRVAGVVLNGESNGGNRESIERYGNVRVIGEIPRMARIDRAALLEIFSKHFDGAAFSAAAYA